MLTKTIAYTDFNGTKREEVYNFNLSKAEVIEMELGTNGGMTQLIQTLRDRGDYAGMMHMFKDLILKSYGIKSIDGRRFEKSEEISKGFEQTGAYEELFIELTTNQDAAAAFIKGILPQEAIVADHNAPELTLTQA